MFALGVPAVITGVMVFYFLPETAGNKLPQNMEGIEMIHK
jgi:hypothetical protein